MNISNAGSLEVLSDFDNFKLCVKEATVSVVSAYTMQNFNLSPQEDCQVLLFIAKFIAKIVYGVNCNRNTTKLIAISKEIRKASPEILNKIHTNRRISLRIKEVLHRIFSKTYSLVNKKIEDQKLSQLTMAELEEYIAERKDDSKPRVPTALDITNRYVFAQAGPSKL